MDITDEMLQAAVGKAIEAGLLPRNASRDDASGSKELMRMIVHAALSVGPPGAFRNGTPPFTRLPAKPSISGTQDAKRAISTYAYN